MESQAFVEKVRKKVIKNLVLKIILIQPQAGPMKEKEFARVS